MHALKHDIHKIFLDLTKTTFEMFHILSSYPCDPNIFLDLTKRHSENEDRVYRTSSEIKIKQNAVVFTLCHLMHVIQKKILDLTKTTFEMFHILSTYPCDPKKILDLTKTTFEMFHILSS